MVEEHSSWSYWSWNTTYSIFADLLHYLPSMNMFYSICTVTVEIYMQLQYKLFQWNVFAAATKFKSRIWAVLDLKSYISIRWGNFFFFLTKGVRLELGKVQLHGCVYQAVVALRQDNGLLQAAQDDLPQILQDPLQHRLLADVSKDTETGSQANTPEV